MSNILLEEQLQSLCVAAIQAAQEAGQYIQQVDRDNLQSVFKDAGSSAASQLVTQVDIHSEEIIRRRLQEISTSLNIAFLGEESLLSNENERFEKPYFWCVDPLDGTLAFAEGRSGFAVSIALLEQSGEPLIGVVYVPDRKILLHAIKGQGSFRDMTSFSQTKHTAKHLMVYADDSFRNHEKYKSTLTTIETCAQTLGLAGATYVYGNGAVRNACHALESNPACYLKLAKKEDGGGSIWDYAATACIAHETGAWASNIYGNPLDLNRRDSTFMNHEGVIFASSDQIARCLIDAL